MRLLGRQEGWGTFCNVCSGSFAWQTKQPPQALNLFGQAATFRARRVELSPEVRFRVHG